MKKLLLILLLVTSLNAQKLIYKGEDGKLYERTSNSDGTGQGFDTEISIGGQGSTDTTSLSNRIDGKQPVGNYLVPNDTTNKWLPIGTSLGGGSDPFLAKLRLTGDITNATTTPAVLTGMSFNYLANSYYIFDMYMLATSAATTTGYGFAVDVSTAVTAVGLTFFNQLANTGTLTGGNSKADNVATGISSGVPAITVSNPIMGRGILITGASGGTATFTFRPEVAASATCKAGSIITVMKIN